MRRRSPGTDALRMERTVSVPVAHGPRLARRLALSGLVAAVVAPLVVANARAALEEVGRPRPWFDTSAAPVIEAVDGGRPLFSLPPLAPGARAGASQLLRVRSEAPIMVTLHADIQGTGLERFLSLTVRRDGEVLYRGTLAGFPSSGLIDPRPWRGTELRAFRFAVRLPGDAAAAGLTARVDFAWEARPA